MHSYKIKYKSPVLSQTLYLYNMIIIQLPWCNMTTTHNSIKDILAKIPADLDYLKQDIKEHIEIIIADTAHKTKLVTTEEFVVQKQVLAKTKIKIAELEHKIAELEQQITKQ
jgi:ubiquinone biosynthesis accessory factor UbiK